MAVEVITGILQFLGDSDADWANQTLPPPAGVLIFNSTTGDVKRGDGVTLYANLPVKFNTNTFETITTYPPTNEGDVFWGRVNGQWNYHSGGPGGSGSGDAFTSFLMRG